MDDSSSIAVANVLSRAGVKKIQIATNKPPVLVSTKELSPEIVSHGEEFIAHYGVKGMRWGVRRSRRQLAKAAKLREKADKAESKAGGKSADSMPSAKAKKKTKASDLSDQELRQRLNRMNMEKQYAELTSPKGSPLKNAGKKVAANVVRGVAESTMKNIGQSYATKYTADFMANNRSAVPKPPMLNRITAPPKTPKLG